MNDRTSPGEIIAVLASVVGGIGTLHAIVLDRDLWLKAALMAGVVLVGAVSWLMWWALRQPVALRETTDISAATGSALNRGPLFVSSLLWGAAVGLGLFVMMNFGNVSGGSGGHPERWPDASALPHHSGRMSLVVFAHPRCPCTRTNIENLRQIMAAASAPLDCHVVVLTPTDSDRAWTANGLVSAAEAIPNVAVFIDEGGAEAERFGAATSGQAILYDACGRLTFSGGFTVSRGQLGDNLGQRALFEFLNDRQTTVRRTPVFGCPLFDDTANCRESAPCPR